ncbi:uncharacterized protein LOC106096046 [Stomoxys calcitrans]|uniref:Uncharacterized protein n=1 Tax=Stomoxys calcitrans TaxID=35570 RepID=A0A1I8NR76_STOCA|nr:uncharacterized protein LOC106096046 [Stomoxys calcitrans]
MQNFDMNMDFLFALLPSSNFEMTNEQLALWQHNAIFECECDNFINRRIEADRQERSARGFQNSYDEAITAAIQQHGLSRRRRRNDNDGDGEGNESIEESNNAIMVPPPTRRSRSRMRPLYFEVYEDAVAEAIRERGLVLRGIP